MLTRTSPAPSSFVTQADAGRKRDPRIDFFRGLALFIILIAHVPFDEWALFIPARFGFSDATEIFVFLSGMASAMAFGRLADREGMGLLCARIAHRIWQIYWAHIGLFVATAALMAAAGNRPDGNTYITALNLEPFFADPATLLPHLFTLTYVPNYFDILPMYMLLLALIPVMLGAERIHRHLPFALIVGLWAMTQTGFPRLPAEPWSDRPWFFDPFGWQMLFFAGFYLKRRPLHTLPDNRWVTVTSVLIILGSVPLSWHPLLEWSPVLGEVSVRLLPLTDKSAFGLLRLIHFAALAHLAIRIAGPLGSRLQGPACGLVRQVGEQSLAIFVFGMFLAQAMGIALDATDRGPLATLLINLAGFALLLVAARVTAWFKRSPWKGH